MAVEKADRRQAARKNEQISWTVWLGFEGRGPGVREEMREWEPLTVWTERGCAHRPALQLQAKRKEKWQGAGPRRRLAQWGRIPEAAKSPAPELGQAKQR